MFLFVWKRDKNRITWNTQLYLVLAGALSCSQRECVSLILLVCTRVRFFCLFVLAGWQAAGCSTQSCDLIVISSSVQVMSDSCSCGERVLEVCIAFPIY